MDWLSSTLVTTQLLITEIDAKRRGAFSTLREAWTRRDLLWLLVQRDVQVRYKQAFFGAAWALLQPLLIMALFWVAFGLAARVQTGSDIPYALFALSGLVPWQLFAYALSHGANSLIDNERLITKVYFPRLLLPVASVIAGLVDFAISCLLLLILLACFGHMPTWQILLAPLGIAICLAASTGLALLLSALNLRFRDVRYTLPLMMQAWLLASPVAYPSTLLPDQARWCFDLNPMAGGVELFRAAVLGTPCDVQQACRAAAVALGLLLAGAAYFRANEHHFADRI